MSSIMKQFILEIILNNKNIQYPVILKFKEIYVKNAKFFIFLQDFQHKPRAFN